MNYFYLYTIVIPLLITGLCLLFFRPLSFKKIIQGLTVNLIPIMFYVLVLYFLEMEEYIKAQWTFYTILFFFVVYIIIIGILNLVKNRLK
jgi:hypothetical protein